MKKEYKNLELIKNESNRHFEMKVGENLAFIKYNKRGNKMALIHTDVEPALKGKGAATAIVEKTLDYIEKNNFKLIPICPFVAAYIKRHPEWKRIVAEGEKGG